MPKFKKEQIGIRINSELRNKLEVLADYNKRTLSDFIRLELEKIVEQEENEVILINNKEGKDVLYGEKTGKGTHIS